MVWFVVVWVGLNGKMGGVVCVISQKEREASGVLLPLTPSKVKPGMYPI